MCASGVAAARPADQRAGGGATPTLALQSLIVRPIPLAMAKELLVREHYLHSFPGGTHLALGVFRDRRLMGALTLGAGPANAHAMVKGAKLQDCLTLTRLWLSDELPRNSESRVLGYTLQNLKRHTQLKFLITYADPAQGHLGYIYQSTNWLYTGLSQATPLYDIGDGRPVFGLGYSDDTRSSRPQGERRVVQLGHTGKSATRLGDGAARFPLSERNRAHMD